MNNNNRLGLINNDLEVITSVIRSIPGITKAVIFGSRAKGTQKTGSDIDLAVWCISDDVSMALSGKLNDETPLPYTFDVINFDHIRNNELISHINRVGVTIYP